MPDILTNAKATGIGTTPDTVYTAPAATTSTLLNYNIANLTAAQINVDVQLAGVYLIKGLPIPAGSAYYMDTKAVLLTGETTVITSDTAASVDVFLSILEQS